MTSKLRAAVDAEQRERELWRKRIERMQQTDLTTVEYATAIGVSVELLRKWQKRLAAEARPTRPTPAGSKGST